MKTFLKTAALLLATASVPSIANAHLLDTLKMTFLWKFIFRMANPINTTTIALTQIILFVVIFCIGTASAQAQTRVSAGFEYGIIGEATTNAHQPERGVLLSTLGISQVVISQLSNNGQFGGTQGNDYDVDVTILFTNGTTATFSAAVNWRDTSGSTVRGIGLIREDLKNLPVSA